MDVLAIFFVVLHLVLRKMVPSIEAYTVSGIFTWIRIKDFLDLCLSTDPDESVQLCFIHCFLEQVFQKIWVLPINGWQCTIT